MIRTLVLALMVGSTAPMLPAQPGIGQNGVVNMASRIAPTLPGGSIARGALFSISGVRLGSAGHTTVTISQNGTVTEAKIIKAEPRQINALMPEAAPLGTDSMLVTVDGQPSKPFPIEVVAFNPGIFSRNGEGWGAGRVENLGARGPTANSLSNPARPGQSITLLTTGLGSTKQVLVTIGDRSTRAGPPRKTGIEGEDQLIVKIPAGAPEGCYVPVFLNASPTRASNVVTITIADGSAPCAPGAIPLLTENRISVIALIRSQRMTQGKSAYEVIEDQVTVRFAGKNSAPVLTLMPPPGTCTTYTDSLQSISAAPSSFYSIVSSSLDQSSSGNDFAPYGLDGGAELTLSNRTGATRTLPQKGRLPGLYSARFESGGAAPRRRGPTPFLEAGDFLLTSPGGIDIQPFTIAVAGPTPFEWTDRDQTSSVNRGHGVALHWKNNPRGQGIFIVATNTDQLTTARGTCICTARADTGQFVIPAAMLANIPASQDIAGVPYDQLFIASLATKSAAPLKPAGLDGGVLLSVYAIGRTVEFR